MGPRTSSPAARAAEHLSSFVPGGPVTHRTTSTPIRCVVVDDNHHFLRAINDVLSHAGITVVGLASTSAEALRHACLHRPDVVLVDVNLGTTSGFDLTQLLMAAAPGWQPTVILMSTYAEKDIRPMLETSPAAAYIPKIAISGLAIRRAHREHRERERPSTGRHRTTTPLDPAGHADEPRRQTGPCRRSDGRSG
ncbi:response regulator [Actinomadura sp. DC4]|nr:response regulator [Actinomadura sp. DC4]